MTKEKKQSMTIKHVSAMSVRRAKKDFGTTEKWSLSDWAVAAAGEMGEACNVVKKLNRIRDGLKGNKETDSQEVLTKELGYEIADTILYLVLLADAADIDIEEAIIEKFNKVSDRIGSSIKLRG